LSIRLLLNKHLSVSNSMSLNWRKWPFVHTCVCNWSSQIDEKYYSNWTSCYCIDLSIRTMQISYCF